MKYTLFLIIVSFSSCCAQKSTLITDKLFPTIPHDSVSVKVEGKLYTEHYRNLETISDSILDEWVYLQSKRTKDSLWTLPEKEKWTSILEDIGSRYDGPPYMFRYGEDGSAFYLKYSVEDDNTSIYSYDKENDNERLLIATDSLSLVHEKRYYVSYYLPSWDGKHLAIEFTDYSGLTGILVVVDANTGKVLDEPLTNCSPSGFGGVSWLPDSSGFLYSRFPVIDSNTDGYKQNSASHLYKLGNKGIGKPVFSSKIVNANNPKVYPAIIVTSSHAKYPIGFMQSSYDFWTAYITDWKSLESDDPNWKPLYGEETKVYTSNFKQVGSKFYFMSGQSENFNISYVDLDAKKWNPVVLIEAPKEEKISDFVINSEGIYFSTSTNGVHAKLYHFLEKSPIKELKMPQQYGEIDVEVLSPTEDILWIYTSGWTTDLKRYRLASNQSFELDQYGAKDIYTEFNNLEVLETEYISKDGTNVPISIIRNPKFKGARPTIITVYGAFAESLTPTFSPLYLTWVAQGGVLAYPHVRGGGEKGVSWYEAGLKTTKRNSWIDVISAAEYLYDKGYSKKGGLILTAGSAGGVTAGMAINEAPELFQGVVLEMPVLNPSRLEYGNYSNNYQLEFGSDKIPAEAKYLFEMDPLLNLSQDKTYPNILILSAGFDDRVDGFQIHKYVATLQKMNNAESMYLYNDPNAGHVQVDDIYNVYGMIFGFSEALTK